VVKGGGVYRERGTGSGIHEEGGRRGGGWVKDIFGTFMKFSMLKHLERIFWMGGGGGSLGCITYSMNCTTYKSKKNHVLEYEFFKRNILRCMLIEFKEKICKKYYFKKYCFLLHGLPYPKNTQ